MLGRAVNITLVRGRGRTPNPYDWAFKQVEKYGKYAKYFDERSDIPAVEKSVYTKL
jgi:hypothetical protein